MSIDGVFKAPSVQLCAESIREKYNYRSYLYLSFSRGGRFMYIETFLDCFLYTAN